MSRQEENKYDNYVYDIKNNEKFIKLKEDVHHGNSKYEHCSRVSLLSYKIANFFHLDKKACARAGLLHDFFYGQRTDSVENSYLNHPKTSAKNAKEVFNVSLKEENMIKTHMWTYIFLRSINPFMRKCDEEYSIVKDRPKSKEGWVICLADMIVSISEWGSYRVSFKVSTMLIFAFNMLALHK